MTYIGRDVEKNIKEDLEKKMVFLSGPRQAGKTTLAKMLLSEQLKKKQNIIILIGQLYRMNLSALKISLLVILLNGVTSFRIMRVGMLN